MSELSPFIGQDTSVSILITSFDLQVSFFKSIWNCSTFPNFLCFCLLVQVDDKLDEAVCFAVWSAVKSSFSNHSSLEAFFTAGSSFFVSLPLDILRRILEADENFAVISGDSLSFLNFSSLDVLREAFGDDLDDFLVIWGDTSGVLGSLPENRPWISMTSPGDNESLRGFSGTSSHASPRESLLPRRGFRACFHTFFTSLLAFESLRFISLSPSSSKFSVDFHELFSEGSLLALNKSSWLPPSTIEHVGSSLLGARFVAHWASSSLISVFSISRACMAASPLRWLELILVFRGIRNICGSTLPIPLAKNVERWAAASSGRFWSSSDISVVDRLRIASLGVGRTGNGGGPGKGGRGANPSEWELLFSIIERFLSDRWLTFPVTEVTDVCWTSCTVSTETAPILLRLKREHGKRLTSFSCGFSIWATSFSYIFFIDSGLEVSKLKGTRRASLSDLDFGGKLFSDLTACSFSNFGFSWISPQFGSFIWERRFSRVFWLTRTVAGESSELLLFAECAPTEERRRLWLPEVSPIWSSVHFSDTTDSKTFLFPSRLLSVGPDCRASHFIYPSESMSFSSVICCAFGKVLGRELAGRLLSCSNSHLIYPSESISFSSGINCEFGKVLDRELEERMFPSSLPNELLLVKESVEVLRESGTGSEMWIGSAFSSDIRSI